MGSKLYVGNLSYNVTSADLNTMFTPHGQVQSAEVIQDRESGRSKGFGFVEFENDEEGKAAGQPGSAQSSRHSGPSGHFDVTLAR